MIKVLYIVTVFIFSINMTNLSAQNKTGLYDFTVIDINGDKFDMSQFEGKKVMIVNVASKCGLTPQYEQLQELYETYNEMGFTIIAFPSNNFNNQEPGSNKDIKEFCEATYNISFPIMTKVDVIGEKKAPIYKWLTEKKENGKLDQEVTWNFQKYLIDRDGKLNAVIMPKVTPMSKEIIDWIKDGK